MSYYRITNKSGSSLVLEDIGIHFSGKGATAVVSKEVFEASKSAKNYSSLISVEFVNTVPVWPFSIPKPTKKSETPEVTVNPAPIVLEPKDNSKEISLLSKKIEELTNLILASHSVPSSPQTFLQPNSRPNREVSRDSDPIFIPSRILPTELEAESRLNIKEEESENKDFDNATSTLKKLRGKS